MHTIIISDCQDANAVARQSARVTSLLGGSVSFVGVKNDLEAAGNIIDALDAFEEHPGIVLANVAPRQGKAGRWGNGTPFGYFWYKKVLVIATIDGYTLSLAKKFNVVKTVNVVSISDTIGALTSSKTLPKECAKYVLETQFRSYEFSPRLAAHLTKGHPTPKTALSIDTISDAPPAVWWIDNFGNCKTTLLKKDLASPDRIQTQFGALPYIPRLKDVPNNTAAIISGSSGLNESRFLEIVVQGKSAKTELNIALGDSFAPLPPGGVVR